MKERPILFSSEMVRAILDGRKTQTRRVIKPQPTIPDDGMEHTHNIGEVFSSRWTGYPQIICKHERGGTTSKPLACPYGQPGDRLWVRETFMLESNYGLASPGEYSPPFKDGRPVKWTGDPDWGAYWQQPHYAATDPKPELIDEERDTEDGLAGWRPSIFMPRWASRITLEIVSVRVERVQKITYADCKAEGIQDWIQYEFGQKKSQERMIGDYWTLWDSINAKRGYPWEQNPWLWVIEFKKI